MINTAKNHFQDFNIVSKLQTCAKFEADDNVSIIYGDEENTNDESFLFSDSDSDHTSNILSSNEPSTRFDTYSEDQKSDNITEYSLEDNQHYYNRDFHNQINNDDDNTDNFVYHKNEILLDENEKILFINKFNSQYSEYSKIAEYTDDSSFCKYNFKLDSKDENLNLITHNDYFLSKKRFNHNDNFDNLITSNTLKFQNENKYTILLHKLFQIKLQYKIDLNINNYLNLSKIENFNKILISTDINYFISNILLMRYLVEYKNFQINNKIENNNNNNRNKNNTLIVYYCNSQSFLPKQIENEKN